MGDDELVRRAIVFGVVGLGSVGLVAWGGARLAVAVGGGGRFDAGLADGVVAAGQLPGRLTDPAAAWPQEAAGSVPGPLVYWVSTLVVLAAVAAVAAGVLWVWQRLQRAGTVDRRRLGVDARAWMARRADLRALIVQGPRPGRFVIGRVGRQLVAAECRATTVPARRESDRRRQGDTGAVALVGPSRSGKTVAAVAGILEWQGPAVLSSVKTDLMAATIGWRARRGEVRVYDPLGLTPYAGAGWSPLAQATTISGARRASRNLLEAIANDGTENLGMWKNLAEYLMAGLFWVAAASGRDMAAVLEWVLTQDRPREGATSEVELLLRDLLGSEDDEIAGAAPLALNYLLSTWDQDERPRSSVYITAQAALSAFSDPTVAAATASNEVDLEWLLSGENTLYICSPLKDQARLAPAFGGLVNDLMGQVYELANLAPSGRLDAPLLMVLDEAGNQRLDQLPEYASTVAGLGVQLVTIWQSVAQITRAYGRGAGIVLTNHLSKLFYAGLSDKDSLEYVARVTGDEEVDSLDLSGDWLGVVRPHVMQRTARVGLVQPHCLRQMVPGDALLIHGTLPPAHIRARRWFDEPELKDRGRLEAPDHLLRRGGGAGPGRPSAAPSTVSPVVTAPRDGSGGGGEIA